MNPTICKGMLVLCLDDDGATEHVKKNRLYTVENLLQRGRFLQLKGVGAPLAASRFTPAKFETGGSETPDLPQRNVANAGY